MTCQSIHLEGLVYWNFLSNSELLQFIANRES